jgi:hypothetical protein
MNPIGYLKSGVPVFDRRNSHLHSGVRMLLPAVLKEYDVTEGFAIITHDFGFTVGKSYCVRVNAGDSVYYEQRPGRRGPSKFVRNRKPEPSSLVTFILKEIEEGYVLITAFVGGRSEPEPWDERAFSFDARGYEKAKAASREFWHSRALIPED